MDLKEIKHQIRLFFRGRETSKNRRIIDLWYHFYDHGITESDELDGQEKELLRQEMLQEIRKQTGISGKKLHKVGAVSAIRNKTWQYKMAAGFVVILLAALPVLLMNIQEPEISLVEYRTSHNPSGQSSQLTLADGTKVWLSANSTLKYPEKFETEYREVILEGEAFFEVKSDANKPFLVRSGALETLVLGTSFNVRAFEDDEDIEITVVTGRISVGLTDHISSTGSFEEHQSVALLYPEQQFIYNNQTNEVSTQQVDSQMFTSWKDGLLIFENHTFKEIADRLSRWYGVEINFSDPDLKQARFRIMFENTSMEHALKMLQATRDFEFEIEPKERQIWIN